MMIIPPPTGPSGDTYSRPYDSEGGNAWTALFLAAALLVGGVLALVSLNLFFGLATGLGAVVIAYGLARLGLRLLAAFWPASILALAAVAAAATGGVAATDAASPAFSTTRAAGSAYDSGISHASTWWERVQTDLRDDGANTTPSWRSDWSGSQPTINWGSLGSWRNRPLPTFKAPSWDALGPYNPPSFNTRPFNPPAYNPPPARINPPAYNPPSYNHPRIPNPPVYNPPIFNPPMPRIPPMPIFPRY